MQAEFFLGQYRQFPLYELQEQVLGKKIPIGYIRKRREHLVLYHENI